MKKLLNSLKSKIKRKKQINKTEEENVNINSNKLTIYDYIYSVANTDEKVDLQNIDPSSLEQIKSLLLLNPELHKKFITKYYSDFIYVNTIEEFENDYTFMYDVEEDVKEELKQSGALLAFSKNDGKTYLFTFLPVFSFKTSIPYNKIGFLSPTIFNFYFQDTLSLDEFESNISFKELLNYIEARNINDFHIRGLDENRYVFTGRIAQEVMKIGGIKPVTVVEDLILQAKLEMGKDTTTEKPEDTGFIKIPLNVRGKMIDRSFRVNIVMSNKIHSQVYSVSIRRLMTIKEIEKLGLEGLGYLPKVINLIRKIQYRKQGLTLVVGKTNSGKSTLLALLLNELYKIKANQEKRIISIENPVEIVTEYDQIDLSVTENADEDKKMTMKKAQKAILRHDPDVVLIGEVRTDDDIQDYVKLGLSSGVNAFTTLHAGDVKTAILRLLNASQNPIDILSSLNGIIAQNLVSKVCQKCKGKKEIKDSEGNRITCPKCKGLGKSGMVPISEIAYFKKVSPSEFINDQNEVDFKRFFDFKYLIAKGYMEYISKTEVAMEYLKKGYIAEEDFFAIKESEEDIYKTSNEE